MTEDTLRRWVRGELPPEQAIDAARFVVRCTDPRLPALLGGMAQELRDERADSALASLGQGWRQLVAAWQGLLERGAAALKEPGGDFVLASADGADAHSLQLFEDPAEAPEPTSKLWAEATAPEPGQELRLYLTDDLAHCVRLSPQPAPSTGTPRQQRALLPQPLGPRATVWAAWLPATSAPAAAEPLTQLHADLVNPDATVKALRPILDTSSED